MNIIIYGRGGTAAEFEEQIKCYNQLNGEVIHIVAWTDSFVQNANKEENVVPVEDVFELCYDYIVIASGYFDEIYSRLKSINIDMDKVVDRTKFYPEKNGKNVGQLINAFYLKQVRVNNEELQRTIEAYLNGNYFVDILGRRRFFLRGWDNEIGKEMGNVQIYEDSRWNLKYLLWKDKRIYYPYQWDEKIIREYHAFNVYTCMNTESAHRYLSNSFSVKEGDIVADIGAAEGLFALSVIDKAKKVYLFETDDIWYRPLQATFSEYSEKVVIEQKCVSNINWLNQTTLDQYFFSKEINFIKMDIEGAEQKVLLASAELLKRDNLKWAIATYHKPEDALFIDIFMKHMGYLTEYAEHYLWVDHRQFGCQPFGEFRKAVIRAYKDK